MDAFAVVLLVGFVIFAAVVLLLGLYYPGSGLEQIGLRTAREITETREELDAQDLDQMLTAHNSRRAAKGELALTADDMELRVMRDVADQRRRRDEYLANERRRREHEHAEQGRPGEEELADRELEQLLEATNARRRRRGEPERTREQAQEELGRPAAQPDGREAPPAAGPGPNEAPPAPGPGRREED